MNFSEDQASVISALLNCGDGFLGVCELSENIHASGERAQDILADLDLLGYISLWERPEGLAFSLSPYGAEILKVRLVGVTCERSIWIPLGEPDPGPTRARGVTRKDVSFDKFESYELRPDQIAILKEERLQPRKQTTWVGPKRRDDAGLLYPTILLQGNVQIPYKGGLCDSCGGSPLAEYTYCLKCDRWGMDGSFEPGKFYKTPTSAERQEQASKVRKKAKKKIKVKSDVAKEKYKAKMKARQAEQKRLKQGLSRVPRKVA